MRVKTKIQVKEELENLKDVGPRPRILQPTPWAETGSVAGAQLGCWSNGDAVKARLHIEA